MTRVKIKHPSPSQHLRIKLLQILSQNLIYATKIITLNDGFVVLTRNDEDLDKIFQGTCQDEIKKANFTPTLPPEIRARRTIIILNVYDTIKDHTEKEIEEELIKENNWIIKGIDNIFKFPKSNNENLLLLNIYF